MTLKVTIPANTSATVFVPTSDVKSVRESGKPLEQSQGVKLEGQRDGAAVLRVTAGEYLFSAQLSTK